VRRSLFAISSYGSPIGRRARSGFNNATTEELRSAAATVVLYPSMDSAADAITEQDDRRPASQSVKWHPSGGRRGDEHPALDETTHPLHRSRPAVEHRVTGGGQVLSADPAAILQ
jgi:hypothetical protein